MCERDGLLAACRHDDPVAVPFEHERYDLLYERVVLDEENGLGAALGRSGGGLFRQFLCVGDLQFRDEAGGREASDSVQDALERALATLPIREKGTIVR